MRPALKNIPKTGAIEGGMFMELARVFADNSAYRMQGVFRIFKEALIKSTCRIGDARGDLFRGSLTFYLN